MRSRPMAVFFSPLVVCVSASSARGGRFWHFRGGSSEHDFLRDTPTPAENPTPRSPTAVVAHDVDTVDENDR
jgi:hypothetical protein